MIVQMTVEHTCFDLLTVLFIMFKFYKFYRIIYLRFFATSLILILLLCVCFTLRMARHQALNQQGRVRPKGSTTGRQLWGDVQVGKYCHVMCCV